MCWWRVALSAITAVAWAFAGMGAVAALGLQLLAADDAAELGPMTAALVVLAAGGSVSPSGDVEVFGLSPFDTTAALGLMPLGVSLTGALLLAWPFLRSLRRAGAVSAGELAARTGATAAAFCGVLAALAWAGHDTITIDRDSLLGGAAGDVEGTGGEGLLDRLPVLGGVDGDGFPFAELIQADASVGFRADAGQSVVRGVVWVVVVLAAALLASRRTPLPHGWESLHRRVRPAVSALCTVLLVAVAAGVLAGAWAAATGEEPGRIMGAVLLGAPNGVGTAVPMGLLVPFRGAATGPLTAALPDPVGRLLADGSGEAGAATVTLGRLADLDGRVWLLLAGTTLMMLAAGMLTAARTPLGAAGLRPVRIASACAVRLGAATAVGLPLLVWGAALSVDAGISVFGYDVAGARLQLEGSVPAAALLGAAWGAAGGFTGGLFAAAKGAAGRLATPTASAQAPPAARPGSPR